MPGALRFVILRMLVLGAGMLAGLVFGTVNSMLIMATFGGAMFVRSALAVIGASWSRGGGIVLDLLWFVLPIALLGMLRVDEPTWFLVRVIGVWAIWSFLVLWFVGVSRMIGDDGDIGTGGTV